MSANSSTMSPPRAATPGGPGQGDAPTHRLDHRRTGRAWPAAATTKGRGAPKSWRAPRGASPRGAPRRSGHRFVDDLGEADKAGRTLWAGGTVVYIPPGYKTENAKRHWERDEADRGARSRECARFLQIVSYRVGATELPGGSRERGEDVVTAANREFWEETGADARFTEDDHAFSIVMQTNTSRTNVIHYFVKVTHDPDVFAEFRKSEPHTGTLYQPIDPKTGEQKTFVHIWESQGNITTPVYYEYAKQRVHSIGGARQVACGLTAWLNRQHADHDPKATHRVKSSNLATLRILLKYGVLSAAQVKEVVSELCPNMILSPAEMEAAGFWAVGGPEKPALQRQLSGQATGQKKHKKKKQQQTKKSWGKPKDGNTCRICGVKGHWIQQCPRAATRAPAVKRD